jgi:retinol dehydrogenase 12
MKATAKSTGIEGRIVNLSSVAHHHTYPKGIDFDNLNDEKKYVRLLFCFVGIECWLNCK